MLENCLSVYWARDLALQAAAVSRLLTDCHHHSSGNHSARVLAWDRLQKIVGLLVLCESLAGDVDWNN